MKLPNTDISSSPSLISGLRILFVSIGVSLLSTTSLIFSFPEKAISEINKEQINSYYRSCLNRNGYGSCIEEALASAACIPFSMRPQYIYFANKTYMDNINSYLESMGISIDDKLFTYIRNTKNLRRRVADRINLLNACEDNEAYDYYLSKNWSYLGKNGINYQMYESVIWHNKNEPNSNWITWLDSSSYHRERPSDSFNMKKQIDLNSITSLPGERYSFRTRTVVSSYSRKEPYLLRRNHGKTPYHEVVTINCPSLKARNPDWITYKIVCLGLDVPPIRKYRGS